MRQDRRFIPIGIFTNHSLISTKTFAETYRLSFVQKLSISAGSAVGAIISPQRADFVAVNGETVGHYAYKNIICEMKKSQSGRQILSSRPRVNKATLETAKLCPKGSFGYAYSKFMQAKIFSPEERPPIRFLDNDEDAYVAMRMREVHDFWHVIFDCPTSVSGELALKLVEFVQTRNPLCAFSAILAPIRLNSEDRMYLYKYAYPRAYSAGMRASILMSLNYESNFHRQLDELRAEWTILSLI